MPCLWLFNKACLSGMLSHISFRGNIDSMTHRMIQVGFFLTILSCRWAKFAIVAKSLVVLKILC